MSETNIIQLFLFLWRYLFMESLKIPQSHTGVSKTLRIPSDIIEDIEALAEIKNKSLNQVTILLVKYALDNLDIEDKRAIENYKKYAEKNLS